jgi:hypothetical protein
MHPCSLPTEPQVDLCVAKHVHWICVLTRGVLVGNPQRHHSNTSNTPPLSRHIQTGTCLHFELHTELLLHTRNFLPPAPAQPHDLAVLH